MSNQQKELIKEAFRQIEEGIDQEKLAIIKEFILKTLKKTDEKKKEKEKIEEELRILKEDLDNLRNGNLDNIEERLSKSPTAREVSQVDINIIMNNFLKQKLANNYYDNVTVTHTGYTTPTQWVNATAGTYNTGYKIYYLNS